MRQLTKSLMIGRSRRLRCMGSTVIWSFEFRTALLTEAWVVVGGVILAGGRELCWNLRLFVEYINYLDVNANELVSKFADETKIE